MSNGDELAAGTDPTSSGSIIPVTSLSNVGGTVQLNFNSEKGKRYTLEQTSDLSDSNSWKAVSPLTQVTASGPVSALTTPYLPSTFLPGARAGSRFRRRWDERFGLEIAVGLDPHSAKSSGEIDPYGRPLTDSEYASNGFARENVVTIVASGNDASATQPEGAAPATDLGIFTLSRGGLAARPYGR